jgi:hypothetical protein
MMSAPWGHRELFIVWHPASGEDGPIDGKQFRAVSAEFAAVDWAERFDRDDSEYPLVSDEGRTEIVKVCPVGNESDVSTFKVRGRVSYDYYADEVPA